MRFGALELLGLITVLQLFVYSENWSEYLFWTSGLLLVLTLSAGVISLITSWRELSDEAEQPSGIVAQSSTLCRVNSLTLQ